MKTRSPQFAAALLLVLACSAPVWAQEPKSASAAKELAQLMTTKNIDSIAARCEDHEQFVSAMSFPGSLMVVWAKTTAPAVVNEKLIRKEYKEVYMDLNSASIPDSKHFVTDIGADGLKFKPSSKGGPADTHDVAGKSLRFDGNWKEDKMSEADYTKAHTDADEAYTKMIEALVAELKKAS